ncbi:MAG TPA: phage tail protein [Rhodanobacteraceae bacterium]|nr:phage tail protein [Rhodanobacteraceae bacterium]
MPAADLATPFVLLDAVQGWQLASRVRLRDADGALTLQPLPGEASALLDAATLASAGMRCPAGLATDGCGVLWLVDAGGDGVWRVRLDVLDDAGANCRAIERIDGIGGKGRMPRELDAPRGIAARGNGVVVADTGNGRVQSFAGPPYPLGGIWQDLGELRPAATSAVPATLARPWSVALGSCGEVFIVDRGHRVVRRIDARARTLATLGEGALGDPLRVALGPHGIVAVVDAGNATVRLFRANETASFAEARPPNQTPLSAAFGDDGTLYVGDAVGLIHAFVPGEGAYAFAGTGDSRVTGRVLDLAWAGARGLFALIEEDRDGRPRGVWRTWPDGGFVRDGEFVTDAIDSDIDACQWHRVLLDAGFVGGHGAGVSTGSATSAQAGVASIEIATYVSSDLTATNALLAAGNVPWRVDALSGDANPDCLVQNGPGRYLWLRVTLRGNGAISPRIGGARLFFPRTSYLEHLPAIYQDDQQSRLFLERFLSIFQTGFDDIDGAIDRLWLLFDPASTPAGDLQWLAAWIGLVIDPDWTPEELRLRIRDAHQRHLTRGTPKGLEQAIGDYVDLPAAAKVLEHFRLRDWSMVSPGVEDERDRAFWTGASALDGTRRLWSRSFYHRLQLDAYSTIGEFRLVDRPEPAAEPFDWGAHRFTVFFPADPNDEGATARRVAAIVEREKPAHATAEYCAVYPRMRVGRQAMVGVDARIGGVGRFTLNRLATLSYDTILGCSPYEAPMRDSGSSPRPRVGTTTVLQ